MKMTMFSKMTSIVLCLLLFSTAVEANTGEILGLKLYNDEFHPSAIEVQEMLKKANLENHGYKKERTTQEVQGPYSNKTDHQTSYFYYKVVNCSKIQEVEQELDKLMPGAFGKELAAKLRKEVKFRHLGDTGKCKVGMEVLLKEPETPFGDEKDSPERRMRRGWGVRVRVGITARGCTRRVRFRRIRVSLGRRRRRWFGR